MWSLGIGRPADKRVFRARFPDSSHGDYRRSDMTPMQLAILNGEKTYIGKKCPHGHDGTRYTSGSHCVECRKERGKKFYADNKELHYARCREWLNQNREKSAERERKKYAANPDKYREKTKKWYANHPEHIGKWAKSNPEKANAISEKWRLANKDIKTAIQIRRQAEKIKRTPCWSDESKIREFYAEAKRITAETGVKHVVDHYYPLQGKTVSGLHVHQNLRVITLSENCRKSNKCPE